MEKIKIAKIVNAVGLRGEVKVYNYSDDRERFEDLDEIIVSGKQETVRKIQGVRYQGNMVILKLEGVNDRNAAEALKESDVYITEDDLRELPEDTFYVRDLIGMKVIDEGVYALKIILSVFVFWREFAVYEVIIHADNHGIEAQDFHLQGYPL